MRIVCWQMILMKYHSLFYSKMLQNLSSSAVVISALSVNYYVTCLCLFLFQASPYNTLMYNVIGDSPAPLYFDVGETTGEVTLRSSLYQDTASQYIVSTSSKFCYKLLRWSVLDKRDFPGPRYLLFQAQLK